MVFQIYGQSMYYYHSSAYLHQTGGRQLYAQQRQNVTWFRKNDIITVNVDCVNWTVKFMKNNVIVGGSGFLLILYLIKNIIHLLDSALQARIAGHIKLSIRSIVVNENVRFILL